MRELRAGALLIALIGLLLWLNPPELSPRVTPPEKRSFTVRDSELDENGKAIVRVGATRREVQAALGGPARTATGRWTYPAHDYRELLIIDFYGDRVTALRLEPAGSPAGSSPPPPDSPH